MADDARKIVRRVCDALRALNTALNDASNADISIELTTTQSIGRRNHNYILARSVREEMILPELKAEDLKHVP